jgi:hypothetical protein
MSRSPDAGRSVIELDPRHPVLVLPVEHEQETGPEQGGGEAA